MRVINPFENDRFARVTDPYARVRVPNESWLFTSPTRSERGHSASVPRELPLRERARKIGATTPAQAGALAVELGIVRKT